MSYLLRENPIPSKLLKDTELRSLTRLTKKTAKTNSGINSTKSSKSMINNDSNLINKPALKSKLQTKSHTINKKSTNSRCSNKILANQIKKKNHVKVHGKDKNLVKDQAKNQLKNLDKKSNENIDKNMDVNLRKKLNRSSSRNLIDNSITTSINDENANDFNRSNEIAELKKTLSEVQNGFDLALLSIDMLNKRNQAQDIAIRFLETIMREQLTDQRSYPTAQLSIEQSFAQAVQSNQLEQSSLFNQFNHIGQANQIDQSNLSNPLEADQLSSSSVHFNSPTFTSIQYDASNLNEQINLDTEPSTLLEIKRLTANKRGFHDLKATTNDRKRSSAKKIKVDLQPKELPLSKPVRRINRINSGNKPMDTIDYATRSTTGLWEQSLAEASPQDESSSGICMHFLRTENSYYNGTELIFKDNLAYTAWDVDANRKLEEKVGFKSVDEPLVLDLSVKKERISPAVSESKEDHSIKANTPKVVSLKQMEIKLKRLEKCPICKAKLTLSYHRCSK